MIEFVSNGCKWVGFLDDENRTLKAALAACFPSPFLLLDGVRKETYHATDPSSFHNVNGRYDHIEPPSPGSEHQ